MLMLGLALVSLAVDPALAAMAPGKHGRQGGEQGRLDGIVHGDHAAHDNASVGVHVLKGCL